MSELRSIRPLPPESMRGIEPLRVGKKLPKFEWVDPRSIFVEEEYQRDMAEGSTTLVRKIVGRFSWARFKPPICVRLAGSGNVLVCVDGQHTATAAATHPGIEKIPVMVVDAADMADRASAFVGHNRDRIALTQLAIFRAELASGDPLAELIARALRKAGAEMLLKPVNLRRQTKPGQTMAVGVIRRIAKNDGEDALARVLKLLVKAERGPIKADEITAAHAILREDDSIDLKLGAVVAEKSAEAWAAIAAGEAAQSGDHLHQALTTVWCRELELRLAPAKSAPGPAPRPAPNVPPPQTPPPAAKPAAPSVGKLQTDLTNNHVDKGVLVLNGVTLNLRTRSVGHRGRDVPVGEEDCVRMVAALARVRPSLLDASFLAKKMFGSVGENPDLKLQGVAQRLNPRLAAVQLEARRVPKIGWTLADLGA